MWGLVAFMAAPAAAQVDLAATDARPVASTAFLEDLLVVDVGFEWMGSYAGPLVVRIRISSDAALDAADPVAFTQTITVTSTETAKLVSGPMPQRRGAYFVIAELDPSNAITETDETNNDVVGSSLTIRGGDLEVSRLTSLGSGQGFPDEPFAYRVEYRNRGPSAVQNVELVVEFRPEGSPVTEVLRTSPETLGATASRIRNESFVLPVGTATGTAELTARVTTSDPVDPDPLNDVEVVSLPVRDPVPDFRGQVIATSTAVEAGERLVVNRVVENGGLVDAPATELLYVLSEDGELATSDVALGRVAVPALAVDEIDVASDVVNVPVTVAPGNYLLGFIIDPDDQVEEVTDENDVPGPRVDVFAPDLRVATESLPVAQLEVPYEVALVAVGGPSPEYRWSILQGAVPGIELDPGAGILSGLPTTEGEYSLTIEVTSGTARAVRDLVLRVVEVAVPLSLADVELPAAVIGRPYDAQLVPSGGVAPYRWMALTPPPAGLELGEDGRLSGIATETSTGVRSFDVRVRDAAGDTAEAVVTLSVVQITQRVTLLVDPLPDAVVGRPYCGAEPVQLRAVGEFPPFVFSAAFPPSGLTLDPDGRLCGTPTRVGTSTFTVNVRDALGLVDDGVFQLRVRNDESVQIVTERLPVARVRRFYEAEVRAEGGAPPYRFDVSVGALPPGFGIEPGGRIAGTSTTTGRHRFAVRATDTRGASRQAGFEIVVVADDESDGCDCRTARPGPWLPGLALLLAAAWGRRRRTR
jgi:MYXO-CTERM domain-containing protein